MQIKHLKTLNIKNMQWMKNKQTSTADFTFLRHDKFTTTIATRYIRVQWWMVLQKLSIILGRGVGKEGA